MDEQRILVIDAGTTSVRSLLFDRQGRAAHLARRALKQHYPRAGHVEHDASEILASVLACIAETVAAVGGSKAIAGVAITNQRETVVAWDKASAKPLARAIVWQDRRTAAVCEALKAEHEDAVREATGLVLDPYFSGTKMAWLVEHEPAVAAAAEAKTLALGTIDSWLVFALTGAHLAEAGNASRTLLLPLQGASWDQALAELFKVPVAALGEVVDSVLPASNAPRLKRDILGTELPVCGIAGDQQAATIGQDCLVPGQAKATYGTGAFILANAGDTPPVSHNRLLSTVLVQQQGQRTFALEGAMFVAGSLVQWLRDGLGIIGDAQESEALARSVDDNGGVVLVPAFTGLGAPHWLADVRAAITGLGFDTTAAHIVRAGLEAMAHQTHDLAHTFAADGAGWDNLRVDGGMAANDWMVQDIADILALPVRRPELLETTALGAAMLAATGLGFFPSLADAAKQMTGPARDFAPAMDTEIREARCAMWDRALGTIGARKR